VLDGTGAASFRYEGGVSATAPSGPLPNPGVGVALEYAPLSFAGAGRVTIRGDFGVVPIDVAIVARPDELVIYGDIFARYRLAVAGSVGFDPVAGITASWELQPIEHLEVTTPLTGVRAIDFHRKADGSPAAPITVTARAGTASATLTLQP
jgi:hypothetical protein